MPNPGQFSSTHQSHHRRTGRTRVAAETRFWPKVQKTEGCWLWKGSRGANGYGKFKAVPERVIIAHRFAFELLVGPVPAGLELDHLCRNRACVNPAHLEIVTHQENSMRAKLAEAQP